MTAQSEGVLDAPDYGDDPFGENERGRRVIPYTYLREADMTWEKRIWRNLDMRDKLNQVFFFPVEEQPKRISIIQLVVKYILRGDLIAFEDDQFIFPVDREAIRKKLVIVGDSVETEIFLPNGEPVWTKVPGPVDSTWIFRNFSSLSLKEDWFFDRQRSVLEVRILGLGFNAAYVGKEDLGEANQFWVYFPACRPFFARHTVYNSHNDGSRLTFDDIFRKRRFTSTIQMESNVFDRTIDQYCKGIDVLLESDRIKNDIMRFEHDLWQF